MERHWSEDPYWVEALNRFCEARASGTKQITIDLDQIENIMYSGDGPAYRLMHGMLSVHENEDDDGYRGASRLVFALLQILSECKQSAASDSQSQD